MVNQLISLDSLRDVVDVAMVAFLLYQGYKLISGTSAMNLARGVVVMLSVWLFAVLFDLTLLGRLVGALSTVGLFAFIVLFQPELRAALERVGRARTREITGDAAAMQELVRASEHLAAKKTGALIAIERSTPLGEYSGTGTEIDAKVSAPFIEALFARNAPLHDGGVIIRGSRVVAAGCVFPLEPSDGKYRRYGTRHRAAMGLSQLTDAVVLIVSEESGSIRIVLDGRMGPHLKPAELRENLLLYVIEHEDLAKKQRAAAAAKAGNHANEQPMEPSDKKSDSKRGDKKDEATSQSQSTKLTQTAKEAHSPNNQQANKQSNKEAKDDN